MNRRTKELLAIHCMAVLVVTLGGGFVVAGWMPPPSPGWDTAHLVAVFRVGNADRVRIAAAMMLFGSAFFGPPCVAIANRLRRIEGQDATFASIQLMMAVCGILAVQIAAACWLAVSFRPDVAPSVVVTLDDIGWYFMLAATGPLMVQMAAIGLGILQGDGTVYPRWLGFLSLWLSLLELPGVVIPFFKSGPLAWNGVLGFWCVALAFFVWAVTIWAMTVRSINKDPSLVDNATR